MHNLTATEFAKLSASKLVQKLPCRVIRDGEILFKVIPPDWEGVAPGAAPSYTVQSEIVPWQRYDPRRHGPGTLVQWRDGHVAAVEFDADGNPIW